jgi:hypothetical protein
MGEECTKRERSYGKEELGNYEIARISSFL